PISASAVATNSLLVAFGSQDGALATLDISSRRTGPLTRVCDGRINALDAHADEFVAFGCEDGAYGILERRTGRITSLRQEGPIFKVQVSPDGHYLVTAGQGGVVHVYDRRSGLSHSYRGHGRTVTALLTASDAFRFFVSGDAGG